jgi:hypothetical protein
MAGGGEIFGFVVMGAGAYALVRWFDFTAISTSRSAISRTERSAIAARKVADDDRMTTPWGDVVQLHPEFRGVKAPDRKGGGGRPVGQGLSVTNGSQTSVQVQNSKPIHSDFGDSNSPTNLAGRGGV